MKKKGWVRQRVLQSFSMEEGTVEVLDLNGNRVPIASARQIGSNLQIVISGRMKNLPPSEPVKLSVIQGQKS